MDVIPGPFSFYLHTETTYGWGASKTVGQEIIRRFGARRVFLVTDPGIVRAGLAEPFSDRLKESGLAVAWYDGVRPNPDDDDCARGAAAAREYGAEVMIALGGGSAIDTAKTIAVLLTNDGKPRDFEGFGRVRVEPAPTVCVPTTAGTGSEVTLSAVITDTVRHVKMTLKDPKMAPRLAVLDPEMTVGLPAAVTAATGIDALVHALEAFTCKKANAITDALALRALELISANLRTAVADGSSRAAREQMLVASHLAGLAFGRADVAAVHCLAEALGGPYEVAHGVANAMFLPAVTRFNFAADPSRHMRAATALGLPVEGRSAEEAQGILFGYLTDLVNDLGIPKLSEVPGIDPRLFASMAETAFRNGSTPSNARVITVQDYERLFAETLGRQ